MAQKDSFFLAGKKQKGGDLNKEKKREFKKSENKNKRQDKFDKNRDVLPDKQQEKQEKPEDVKKPFDKKAYRLKKYSKKYKLQQFEEQRKKKILHNYQKTLKNDNVTGSYKSKPFDEDITDSNQNTVGRFVRHPDLMKEDDEVKIDTKPKKEAFHKAKEQFKKVQQEKLDKKEQALKAQQERAQKQAEYKKKKQERFKKLSVKNKKGQPVMATRMELLLNKIQSGLK